MAASTGISSKSAVTVSFLYPLYSCFSFSLSRLIRLDICFFFFLPVLICNQRFVVVELSELIVETSDCLRF